MKTLQPHHPEMIPVNGLTYFYLHFLKSLVYLKKMRLGANFSRLKSSLLQEWIEF